MYPVTYGLCPPWYTIVPLNILRQVLVLVTSTTKVLEVLLVLHEVPILGYWYQYVWVPPWYTIVVVGSTASVTDTSY